MLQLTRALHPVEDFSYPASPLLPLQEAAARAYDRAAIYKAAAEKGPITTNFDLAEYAEEMERLQAMTQQARHLFPFLPASTHLYPTSPAFTSARPSFLGPLASSRR